MFKTDTGDKICFSNDKVVWVPDPLLPQVFRSLFGNEEEKGNQQKIKRFLEMLKRVFNFDDFSEDSNLSCLMPDPRSCDIFFFTENEFVFSFNAVQWTRPLDGKVRWFLNLKREPGPLCIKRAIDLSQALSAIKEKPDDELQIHEASQANIGKEGKQWLRLLGINNFPVSVPERGRVLPQELSNGLYPVPLCKDLDEKVREAFLLLSNLGDLKDLVSPVSEESMFVNEEQEEEEWDEEDEQEEQERKKQSHDTIVKTQGKELLGNRGGYSTAGFSVADIPFLSIAGYDRFDFKTREHVFKTVSGEDVRFSSQDVMFVPNPLSSEVFRRLFGGACEKGIPEGGKRFLEMLKGVFNFDAILKYGSFSCKMPQDSASPYFVRFFQDDKLAAEFDIKVRSDVSDENSDPKFILQLEQTPLHHRVDLIKMLNAIKIRPDEALREDEGDPTEIQRIGKQWIRLLGVREFSRTGRTKHDGLYPIPLCRDLDETVREAILFLHDLDLSKDFANEQTGLIFQVDEDSDEMEESEEDEED